MYLGIGGLRAANEAIEYTNEMIEEVIRCKEDIIYFAEHYFHIVTIDEGKQLITLFDYQKKMLKAFIDPPDYKSNKTEENEPKRHIIVKIARQSGKCFFYDTVIKIKNKKTGKIQEINIEDFYSLIKTHDI